MARNQYWGGRTGAVAGIDAHGAPLLVNADRTTGNLGAIESAHDAIHQGWHYTMTDIDADVDIAGPKYWLIRVPGGSSSSSSGSGVGAPEYHAIFGVNATGAAVVELFSSPEFTGMGSEVDFVNSNMNSNNETAIQAFRNPVVNNDGDRVFVSLLSAAGSVSPAPNSPRADSERILAPGDYLLKVTVIADDTQVSALVAVYEAIRQSGDVDQTPPIT